MNLSQNISSGAANVPSIATLVPRLDVLDTQEEVIYLLELPGTDEDRIDLEVSKTELLLSAPVISDQYDKAVFLYQERVPGSYYRQVAVPAQVNADQVQANYANGILEVRFPKKDDKVTLKKSTKGKRNKQVAVQ